MPILTRTLVLCLKKSLLKKMGGLAFFDSPLTNVTRVSGDLLDLKLGDWLGFMVTVEIASPCASVKLGLQCIEVES